MPDLIVKETDSQRLVEGRWSTTGTLVTSTNKTVRHDITEILLKVAFNIITLTQPKETESAHFNCMLLNNIG
jgi:hypothetical protein